MYLYFVIFIILRLLLHPQPLHWRHHRQLQPTEEEDECPARLPLGPPLAGPTPPHPLCPLSLRMFTNTVCAPDRGRAWVPIPPGDLELVTEPVWTLVSFMGSAACFAWLLLRPSEILMVAQKRAMRGCAGLPLCVYPRFSGPLRPPSPASFKPHLWPSGRSPSLFPPGPPAGMGAGFTGDV